MAQRFRTLTVLAEDPTSIPRTHRDAHNCLYLQLQGVQHPLLAFVRTAHTGYTSMHACRQNTLTHDIKLKNN